MKIVAFADSHGRLPDPAAVPACDLLVIAGDLSPAGCKIPEVVTKYFDRRLRPWLERVPAKRVVAVAGNHDFIFHRWPKLVPAGLRWDYLEDREITVDGVRIWGTPWTPVFCDWAFMREEEELAGIFSEIPAGIDLLVTHGPAYGVGDVVAGAPPDRHLGAVALRRELYRVQPLIHLFGHIHTGDHQTLYLAEVGTAAHNVALADERNQPQFPLTVFEFDFEAARRGRRPPRREPPAGDDFPEPFTFRLRSADEVLASYQDPATWRGMLEDVTDPALKADLARWVDSLPPSPDGKP